MAHPKPASKRRRRSKALPVLGAAGLSLSLASGASAVPAGPALPTQNTIEVGQNITLGEEEIADVSLATFYVFDKENDGTSGPLQRVGHGCGGCARRSRSRLWRLRRSRSRLWRLRRSRSRLWRLRRSRSRLWRLHRNRDRLRLRRLRRLRRMQRRLLVLD